MSCENIDDVTQIGQGQTFSFVVGLKTDLSPEVFKDWKVSAQVRRYKNRASSGFLCNLEVSKLPDPDKNLFLIHYGDTSKWPVGKIEMDLLLENLANNFYIRTKPKVFNVNRAITRQ